MDIELINMMTTNELKDINFGSIFNYELRDDATFYSLNNTCLITQELCKITNILENLNINYVVDENYNIKVEID